MYSSNRETKPKRLLFPASMARRDMYELSIFCVTKNFHFLRQFDANMINSFRNDPHLIYYVIYNIIINTLYKIKVFKS